MRVIDDLISDFKYKKYKDKFTRYRVSPIMATVHITDDGINIIRMVNSSYDYSFLRDTIIVDLLGPRENDCFISSLLFGLFFGTFNLYSYMYINPDVRREIAISEPDRKKTEDFFSEHEEDLFSYFNKKYGLDRDKYNRLKEELFNITIEENGLYNSPIIKDLEKILMGWTLSDEFTSCEELIELFNKKNEINVNKTI